MVSLYSCIQVCFHRAMKTWSSETWLTLLAIVLLLGALGTFPYVYYQILDWVVMGAALVIARRTCKEGKMFEVWCFVAVAVVFNPFAPLYLTSGIWRIADVVVAALFAVSLALSHRRARSA